MRNTFKKTTLSLALATGLIGSTAWSTAAQACSLEPLISSVCIMAVPSRTPVGFALARGQQLTINQYQALYSLIGTTYGGDGKVSFKLPDLSGRVVVGSGTYADGYGTQNYLPGNTGGARAARLSLEQLPQHNHALLGAAVDISKMTAITTLSGLTTTTNLAGVGFSASGANLTLKASTATAGSSTPTSSSYLGSNTAPTAKIYGTASPNITMSAGSISGNVSGTLSGTAPGTVSGGSVATTLGGTASVSGSTDTTGMSAPVALMPPYLVMNYFIATDGTYPQFQ